MVSAAQGRRQGHAWSHARGEYLDAATGIQRKAACAVQLLGRGIDWERANGDGALSSMVDGPAFKHAFFESILETVPGF